MATEYYVSTDGDNNNNGLSENEAWRTLSHVVEKVKLKPGDIVWIKAGVYKGENVVFIMKGIKNNPILCIGS